MKPTSTRGRHYVAKCIDERTGLDVSVDQARYGDGGGDRVELARGASWESGKQAESACETVREALRTLWDDFCADESAWPKA